MHQSSSGLSLSMKHNTWQNFSVGKFRDCQASVPDKLGDSLWSLMLDRECLFCSQGTERRLMRKNSNLMAIMTLPKRKPQNSSCMVTVSTQIPIKDWARKMGDSLWSLMLDRECLLCSQGNEGRLKRKNFIHWAPPKRKPQNSSYFFLASSLSLYSPSWKFSLGDRWQPLVTDVVSGEPGLRLKGSEGRLKRETFVQWAFPKQEPQISSYFAIASTQVPFKHWAWNSLWTLVTAG